jgi:hypothetical protein
MTVTARVTSGVQAIEVAVAHDSAIVTAVVTREALEECWDVGPDQQDLLKVFETHGDEIREAVLRRADATGKRLLVLTTMR